MPGDIQPFLSACYSAFRDRLPTDTTGARSVLFPRSGRHRRSRGVVTLLTALSKSTTFFSVCRFDRAGFPQHHPGARLLKTDQCYLDPSDATSRGSHSPLIRTATLKWLCGSAFVGFGFRRCRRQRGAVGTLSRPVKSTVFFSKTGAFRRAPHPPFPSPFSRAVRRPGGRVYSGYKAGATFFASLRELADFPGVNAGSGGA